MAIERTMRRKRPSWRASIRPALLGGLLVLLTVSAEAAVSAVTPSERVVLYLLGAQQYVSEGNYAAAREALERIIGLEEEHELELPEFYWLVLGQVLNGYGLYAEAVASLTYYLELIGQSGTRTHALLIRMHALLTEYLELTGQSVTRDLNVPPSLHKAMKLMEAREEDGGAKSN